MSTPDLSKGSPVQDFPVDVGGENLASVLFDGLRGVGAVFLTHNSRVLDREFDNDVCAHVNNLQFLAVICVLCLHT